MTKYFIPSEIYVQTDDAANFFTKKIANISFKKNDSLVHELTNPISFENKPRKGFILNREVHKNSAYFRNNNEARIFDPLGFEYIISTDNFIEILKYSSLNDGVFEEEMILVFQGKNLVLVPTKLLNIKEAIAKKETKFELISEQNPLIGSHYKIFISYQEKTVIYLGHHNINEHILNLKEQSSGTGIFSTFMFDIKKTKKHVFIEPDSNIFYYMNNINTTTCQNNNCDPRTEYYTLIFNKLNNVALNLSIIPHEGNICLELENFLKEKPLLNSNNLFHYLDTFFSSIYLSYENQDNPTLLGFKRKDYGFEQILHLGLEISDITHNSLKILERKNYNPISPFNLINHEQAKELSNKLSQDDLINKTLEFITPFMEKFSIFKLQYLKNENISIFGNPYLFKYLIYGYKYHNENSAYINFKI